MKKIRESEKSVKILIQSGSFMICALAAIITGTYWHITSIGIESRPWVKGKILQSGATPGSVSSSASSRFKSDCLYEYSVNHSVYQSGRLSYSAGSQSSLEAQAHTAYYPVGKTVRVYYNPQDPSDAVLEPQENKIWQYSAWSIGVLFFLFGLFPLLQSRPKILHLVIILTMVFMGAACIFIGLYQKEFSRMIAANALLVKKESRKIGPYSANGYKSGMRMLTLVFELKVDGQMQRPHSYLFDRNRQYEEDPLLQPGKKVKIFFFKNEPYWVFIQPLGMEALSTAFIFFGASLLFISLIVAIVILSLGKGKKGKINP